MGWILKAGCRWPLCVLALTLPLKYTYKSYKILVNEFPGGEIQYVVITNLQLPLKSFKNTLQFSSVSLQKQKPLSGMLFYNLRSAVGP